MREWICLGCRTVFQSGPNPSLHCEEKGIVPFSPADHAHLLLGMSNSWASIERAREKWDSNPIYQEVHRQAFEEGCNGAARIHIRFVNRLIELTETSHV